MRRLKCLGSIPKKYIVFCITGLCLFASILIANNTYAATARVTAGIRGIILFQNNGNVRVFQNNQDSVSVTGNPPFYILGNDSVSTEGSDNFYLKVLTGVNFNVGLSGGSTSNKYNQVTTYWKFSQDYRLGNRPSWYDYGKDYAPAIYYATASGNLPASSCSLYEATGNYITWQCVSQTTEQNNPIISASFIWGNYSTATASNYPTLCAIGAYPMDSVFQKYSGNCTLHAVTYDYISTPDQSAALLQELNSTVDGINSTIDQNHQEDIERDNQDRENIQNQQDDVSDSADSAQEQVENATSSLIANIKSVLDVFGTSASNCRLNVNTGFLDLHDVDVCSIPSEIKTLINTIVGIILVPAFLFISFNVIMTIFSMFNEFFGTGSYHDYFK